MPIQYVGIADEHRAVRESFGIFDVSHMGQVETSGPDAIAFLQRVLSNDVTAMSAGDAQYSMLCREDGGVLDDLFSYRLAPNRFLTVTNAANHVRDLQWLREQADGFDVDVLDRIDEFAMLAVQGPGARAAVAGLTDGELPERFRTRELDVAGVGALVCGTGYTGEEGVEILCAPDDAGRIWDVVVAAGGTPVGLGARDTLRLEVCFHLYGNDLIETRGPIEAGVGWACKEETGFIGAAAVSHARQSGTRERLVPFRIDGAGIARAGDRVIGGGEVTSGTYSPSLGVGIGMAYVPCELAKPGQAIEIDVRGRTRGAVVVKKPIYRSPGS
jgi:aminomethyltransferase